MEYKLNPEFFNTDIETHQTERIGDNEFLCPVCGFHIRQYVVYTPDMRERVKNEYMDHGNTSVAHAFGMSIKAEKVNA